MALSFEPELTLGAVLHSRCYTGRRYFLLAGLQLLILPTIGLMMVFVQRQDHLPQPLVYLAVLGPLSVVLAGYLAFMGWRLRGAVLEFCEQGMRFAGPEGPRWAFGFAEVCRTKRIQRREGRGERDGRWSLHAVKFFLTDGRVRKVYVHEPQDAALLEEVLGRLEPLLRK